MITLLPFKFRDVTSGNFFYRKSTIGTTIAATEANNDTYFLQKRMEKFPLIMQQFWQEIVSLVHPTQANPGHPSFKNAYVHKNK